MNRLSASYGCINGYREKYVQVWRNIELKVGDFKVMYRRKRIERKNIEGLRILRDRNINKKLKCFAPILFVCNEKSGILITNKKESLLETKIAFTSTTTNTSPHPHYEKWILLSKD